MPDHRWVELDGFRARLESLRRDMSISAAREGSALTPEVNGHLANMEATAAYLDDRSRACGRPEPPNKKVMVPVTDRKGSMFIGM